MRLSLFRHVGDDTPLLHDTTWSEFIGLLSRANFTDCVPCPRGNKCIKKKQELFTPGVYRKGTKRALENIESMTALVYDLDHLTTEVISKIDLPGIESFVHSSHSDAPEIDDRCFRLIVNLSRELTPEEWKVLYFGVAARFGIPYDEGAKDIARMFFVPSTPQGQEYFYHLQEGQPLDVERWLSILATRVQSPVLQVTSINSEAPRSYATSTPGAVDSPSSIDYDVFLDRVKEIHRRKRNMGLQPDLVTFYEQALAGDPIRTATSRNVALSQLVGSLLYSFGTSHNDAIRVLLRPSCIAMGEDEPGKTYLDILDAMLARKGPVADAARETYALAYEAPSKQKASEGVDVATSGDVTIDAFNANYFLGWNADRTEYLHWKEDKDQITPVSQKSVQTETKPLKKVTPEGKLLDGYPHWVSSQKRRSYDRVVFAPMKQLKPTEYNLFKGYGVQPSPLAEWPRIREYWQEVLCAGDEALFKYTFTWCAQMVQEPCTLPGIALVIYGAQHGSGKSTFFNILHKVLGHKLCVSESDVTRVFEGFNGHLERALLVNINESESRPTKKLMDLMKHAITEPTKQIEHKGMTRFDAPNYTRYIIISNSQDAVHIDETDRRFQVITPSAHRVGDRAYYNALYEELSQTDATSGLLHDLLTFDLANGVDLRNLIETDARRDMRRHSRSPVVQFWEVYETTLTDDEDVIPYQTIFDAFRNMFPSYRIGMLQLADEILRHVPEARYCLTKGAMGTKLPALSRRNKSAGVSNSNGLEEW